MSVNVRRSLPGDSAAIAAIAEQCFGDPFDQDRICRLLEAGRNYTLVALEAQRILGFADSFVTVSESGDQRLEMDLLAVEPEAQGKGIGRRLIGESILLAQALRLPLLRTLVRTENAIMRGLCLSCGFVESNERFELYVRFPGPGSVVAGDSMAAHLVPVETLAYSGIWIEVCLTQGGISRALGMSYDQQLQVVGGLVRQSDRDAVQLLADNGFRLLGTYFWCSLKLKTG